jgi:hypothetical protein
MTDSPDFSAMQARAEQSRLEFLQADLELCFTFADLMETELSMEDYGAEQTLTKAEAGYETIARLLRHLGNGQQRDEISQGLGKLRLRLDDLRSRLRQRNAFQGEPGSPPG